MAYQRTPAPRKKKESGEKINRHTEKPLKYRAFLFIYKNVYARQCRFIPAFCRSKRAFFIYLQILHFIYANKFKTKGKQPEERKIFPVGKRCVNNPENTLQNEFNLQNKTGAIFFHCQSKTSPDKYTPGRRTERT